MSDRLPRPAGGIETNRRISEHGHGRERQREIWNDENHAERREGIGEQQAAMLIAHPCARRTETEPIPPPTAESQRAAGHPDEAFAQVNERENQQQAFQFTHAAPGWGLLGGFLTFPAAGD